MIQKWIKWKLLIRWKNQWNYLKFFRNIPSGNKLWTLALAMSAFNFIAIFFGTYFLFKVSVFNKDFLESQFNGIIFNLIGKLLVYMSNNYDVLWSMIFLIILLFSIVAGISSSKWQLQSIDKDWLITNLKISPARTRIYLYLESTAWYSKDFLFSYVPVILALGVLTEIHWLRMSIIVLFTFFLFIFMSLITSIFHNRYLSLQRHKQNFIFRMVFSLLLRSAAVYVAFWSGKFLSPWINDFPVTSNDMDLTVYQSWINEGSDALISLLTPLNSLLQHPFLPHNVLTMILFDNITVSALIYITLAIAFLSMVAFFLSRYDSNDYEKVYYPFKKLEHMMSVLTRPLGKHYTAILFNHQLRTTYFFHRFPAVLGSIPFWLQLGVFSGLLNGISPENNIYYLVLSFYLFFFVFFYVDSVYTNLMGIFSLDSEGKKILIHFLAGKTLWEVFKYKIRFFIVLTYPLLLLGDVFFLVFNQVDWLVSGLTIILHSVVYLLYSAVLFLPSVVSPHFNYLNIEQLDEFPDKKTLQDTLKFSALGIIIPSSMLPTALLITDLISFSTYILFQWIVMAAIISASLLGIVLWIKKRLTKISNIDQLSL
ncbi:hypothetical protein [Metabacillus idriensis]|uniref:hypothetical protein n=1 Tax=Metabacillus idriensis TaxID=324768 RepID=UPI00174CC6C8|nr:hypothetical protein [Metabacillus idriensis]